MCKNFAVTVRQKGIPFAAQVDSLDNLDGFLKRYVASDNTKLPCGIKFLGNRDPQLLGAGKNIWCAYNCFF